MNAYTTNNKNAAAFGKNALSKGQSGGLLNGGQYYGSGNAVGQAEGEKAYSYSNLNGNNFGYGAMQGGTQTYTNGDKAVSVSEIKSNPFV